MSFAEVQSPIIGAGTGQLYEKSRTPDIIIGRNSQGVETLSIPHAADTSYLAHGYYRYIGKYPPQIVSYLMNDLAVTGPVLDPMVGGGTTLIEARLRGLDAVGCDINPVSRLISECASAPVDPDEFESHATGFLKRLGDRIDDGGLFSRKVESTPPLAIKFCREYFSDETLSDIAVFNSEVEDGSKLSSLYRMVLFAVLRRISRANIKKMNLEIDEKRDTIPRFLPTFTKHLHDVIRANREYYNHARGGRVQILDVSAEQTGLPDNHFGAVFLHPPYLTNTAFSEFTQLQLAVSGINHKDVWKRELRCRGSFLHESNGLRKYLVGWKKILEEASRVLVPGGVLITVVGDGQIDYVRIPVGAITAEFGRDIGFTLERQMIHTLNNHTGQTQSRKMTGQHIAVFRKL